jgi:hypothetical protein
MGLDVGITQMEEAFVHIEALNPKPYIYIYIVAVFTFKIILY